MSLAKLMKSWVVVVALAVGGCDRVVEPLGECVRGVWLDEPFPSKCSQLPGLHDAVLDPLSDCHPVTTETLEADGNSSVLLLHWSSSARLVKSEMLHADGWWKVEKRTLTWRRGGGGSTQEARVYPDVQCDAEALRPIEYGPRYTRAGPDLEAAIRKAMAQRNAVFSY